MPDFDNASKIIEKNSILTLPADGPWHERLKIAGLIIAVDGDGVRIEEPFPGTPLFQELQAFDFYADRSVQLDKILIDTKDRPAHEIFYLPAFILLGLILWSQKRRYRVASAA